MKQEYLEQYPGATDDEIKEALAETEYTAFALQNVDTVLEAVANRFPAGMRAFIQEGTHFRYDIATIKPYKGNRDTTHKPKYYAEIKQHIVDRWGGELVTEIETDDELSITQFADKSKSTCIVSTDKDMLCCPGWHFNWVKNELLYQPIKEANLFHFHQMVTGDPVDNIMGIPRHGPKAADKLLEENNRDVDAVRRGLQELYKLAFGEQWEANYVEMSRLLWILRKREQQETGCPFLYG